MLFSESLVLSHQIFEQLFEFFLIEFQFMELLYVNFLSVLFIINCNSLLFLWFNPPIDITELVSCSHLKVLIFVNILSVVMPYFMEPIHIELPNERREVFVLKVFGQNFFCKFCDAFDVERIAGGGPTKNRLDRLILSKWDSTPTIWNNLLMKTGRWWVLLFLALLRLIAKYLLI